MAGASKWFFGLLEGLGVNRLFGWLDGPKIVILRYHGVLDRGHGRTPMGLGGSHVSPADLERQVRVIQRRYRIVSLEHAVDMVTGRRPFEPNCVVLTFDDGYRNNFTHAAPLLDRLGSTATFFLATRFVDERRPLWFDRVEHLVATTKKPELTVEMNGCTERYSLNGERGRKKTLSAIKSELKRVGTRNAEPIIDVLEDRAETRLSDRLDEDDWTAPMSWSQARELADRGFTIGSHTVSHEMLAHVDRAAAAQELRESRAIIERKLNKSCELFCYPNGDHDDASVAETRSAGYRAAVATTWGYVRPGDDPFTLKRVSVEADIPDAKLLAALSGLLPRILRVRDWLRGRKPASTVESDS